MATNSTWLKADPSFNVDLPNNASEPQKYLRTRVIGSVEAVEELMSFHQSQMTREVIYLPTDIKSTRRMLKSKRNLVRRVHQTFICLLDLYRPQQLKDITYPDFFKWWRAVVTNIRKVKLKSAEGNLPCLRPRSTDDFEQFVPAKRIKTNAIHQLSLALCSITNEMPEHLMILLRCVKYEPYNKSIVNEIKTYFLSEGFSILPDDCRPLSRENIVFGTTLITRCLHDPKLLFSLETTHDHKSTK